MCRFTKPARGGALFPFAVEAAVFGRGDVRIEGKDGIGGRHLRGEHFGLGCFY